MQIDRFGYLHKNFAGILKKDEKAPEIAGFVFRPEQHVDQGGDFATGGFTEKYQLRNNINRAVNGFLGFDQVLNRIRLGFDKSTVKSFLPHQGQEAAASVDQLLLIIASIVWVRP